MRPYEGYQFGVALSKRGGLGGVFWSLPEVSGAVGAGCAILKVENRRRRRQALESGQGNPREAARPAGWHFFASMPRAGASDIRSVFSAICGWRTVQTSAGIEQGMAKMHRGRSNFWPTGGVDHSDTSTPAWGREPGPRRAGRPEQQKDEARNRALKPTIGCFVLLGLAVTGCQQQKPAAPAGAGMQGMPVRTVAVSMAPVAQASEYVATIKSRKSATMQPQVDGRLTLIRVKSGDHVKAGQALMQIDPERQVATVESQKATERQKKALYDYNVTEDERQRKLFEAGITSRAVYDQAEQSFANTKADYEAAVAQRKTAEEQLAYYTIRAPFAGVVGDIPVHVGDYVAPATMLTTVDENKDLEAYIYIPTERSAEVHTGLDVELMDNSGKLLEKTKIDFMSPQVDPTLQGILVKAPVHTPLETLRTAQMIKARVIWSNTPMAVVPVLAVMRQGGHLLAMQTQVTLGDTVENNYSVIAGLKAGDKVIVSGTQFLVNGMPVIPLGG